MKPLYGAIVVSVIVASVAVPALQASADEERSSAWSTGYADAFGGKDFNNPYPLEDPLNNTDYICGYIVGRSARNGN